MSTANRIPLTPRVARTMSVAAITLSLVAAGCTSSAESDGVGGPEPGGATTTAAAAPAQATAPELAGSSETGAIVSPALESMILNIAQRYTAAEVAWPSFKPNDHPAIVIVRNGDAVDSLIAFNHPDPDALGQAEPVSLPGLPFTVHAIANPTEAEDLAEVAAFEFQRTIGGADSFAMIADASDDFFAPDGGDYAATFIHELFHRHQILNFDEDGEQDIDGYPLTAQNLALATLEERALRDALGSTTDADREQASRRLAALRLARRALLPEVELDDDQEIAEGTARFIEHKTAPAGAPSVYGPDNFEIELQVDLESAPGIKETFAFGRFYASGAALIELLHRFEVPEVTGRIEAGEPPATILAEHLGVTGDDVDVLVQEARDVYDPEGNLDAQAKEAEATAADEPPVFSTSDG